MNPVFPATKVELRQQAKARRAALSPQDRAAAARRAAEHFLHSISIVQAAPVAVYLPIGDELETGPLIAALRGQGQQLCLPVVQGKDLPLSMRLWAEEDALVPAGFGSLAPGPSAPEVRPGLVIAPVVGFDHAGTRLGYGGGYYDRTLAGWGDSRPLVVGLAFSVQRLGRIPRESHDLLLDFVVTERGVEQFSGRT